MDQLLLITIIVLTFAGFAFEVMPIDAVAFTCLGLLLLFGLVTPEEAIAGFSNPAVVTVMMMFILSYGLTRSGLLSRFAHRIARVSGHTHWTASTILLIATAVISAFINNTAAVAIFLPVAMQLAKQYRFSPSKILIPLSYVSIIGGTCTLIGTSTNLLISAIAVQHGQPPFNVFDFAALGVILLIVGTIYIFAVPMRFLPSRSIISSLTRKYHMSAYLTELRVPGDSPLVGSTVLEEHINERFELTVLEVLRGPRRIAIDLRNTRIEDNDILILRGNVEEIISFRGQYGLHLIYDTKVQDTDLSDENTVLAEVQVAPTSRLAGRSLRDIDFRRLYGCFVLALNRTGETIRDRLASIPLKHWDTLLVFGPRSRVESLSGGDDFVSLGELDLKLRLARRWWMSLIIIPAVVLLAATGLMGILEASILGAIAMIVTRTITIQQSYQAINWTVIFLLASIIPLGAAMENTGLAERIGRFVIGFGGGLGPIFVLSTVYLITALLSEIVSNNSTAVLMAPIAITVAAGLGVETKPFLMAVAYGASSSFLTPMGYQTNAMVYGPGGYRFMDFVRAGAPLKVIFWILGTVLIPIIWPL